MQKALKYADQKRTHFLDELQHILRIPSISTLPEHKPDIERMAEWLRVHLLEIGMEKAEVMPTQGHPVVYAEWLKAKNKPTLLIYGHYDVQPTDPIDEWKTKPFEPEIKDQYIYARGVADDKAQFFTHLKAIQAYLRTSGSLPLNIKVLLEGEEEVGSANLEMFIKQNRKDLKSDAVVVVDTLMTAINQPRLEIGLRGALFFDLTLQTGKIDLHSGSFGGGVSNAAFELMKILVQLTDKQNKVTIPGFYDDVVNPGKKELKVLYSDKKTFYKSAQSYLYKQENEFPSHLMPGIRPSLDINGLWSGFTNTGIKGVIPAKAHAKVNIRIVKNQNPEKISQAFTRYLKHLTPQKLKLSITEVNKCSPVLVSYKSPAVKAAVNALEQTFGAKPHFAREGGSIPAVEIMQRILKNDPVLMGYSLPDDNLHAPNERFYLLNFHKGIENNIRFYHLVSKSG